MSFASLTPDHDANLVFRADVAGAAGCEGQGLGVARNMSRVDEDPGGSHRDDSLLRLPGW